MQKKLKTLIVENRKDELQELKDILAPHADFIEITAEAASMDEAVRILSKDSFDLSILDIDLEDGTCYDLIEIVDRKKFGIIVLNTIAPESNVKKNQSAGNPLWLPKPYSTKGTIQFIYQLKMEVNKTDIELCSYEIYQTNKNRKIIWDDKIFFLEGNKGGTNFYIIDKIKNWDMISTNNNLGKEEERMNKGLFVRCHLSYIVNVRLISDYSKNRKSGGLLYFKYFDLKDIPYTGTYADALFEKMNLR